MDAFRQSSYSLPWRTAFEANAAVVWLLCAVVSLALVYFSDYSATPFYAVSAISIGFGVLRAIEARNIWNLRINLLGRGMLLTPLASYIEHADAHPDDLWLGKGFLWEKNHTQRLYDVVRADERHFMPPAWYAKMRGFVFEQQKADSPGLPWIHGVSEREDDIHLPFSLLEGNTLILGTTGSGKSTLLRCIISACVRRGDTVIVIDPKGDLSLRDTMERTCAMTPGRERDFVYFHTAFAQRSVRYDVLRNFDRVTSIASRISAQVPSRTGGSDPFVSFAWRVLLVYSQLLIICGDRPTIGKIRANFEIGIEPLLERAMVLYFDHVRPVVWRAEVAQYVDMARNDKLPRPSKDSGSNIVGYVEYYRVVIAEHFPDEAISAGVALYRHDRAHVLKMTASLTPVLAQLDAGDLGQLISPDYLDVNDERPIYDSESVVERTKVVYFGLDALSDAVVSSAIGSILVADLAALAGARYNYGTDPKRITLIVDEANEVVSTPFQQLASKGRGAGFTMFAASQTVPDYVSRLGSQEKALSVLGNFNNLLTFRLKDPATTLFVSEQFGKGFVDSRSYGLNTSSSSDNAVTAFSGGEGVTVKDQLMEVIPPDLLLKLPNHQFFGLLAGGKLYKGRQPVIF